MSNINPLLGVEDPDTTPRAVFDKSVMEFIARLSGAIFKAKNAYAYPDLISLAFWSRKSNLSRLPTAFGNAKSQMGRGLCFHISPANVPINFAFSWLFSLLAGNANVARAPSREFPQIDIFCALAREIIKDFPDLAATNAIIRYPRDNEITRAYSLKADARMIWGGDSTIELLRSMPVKPRCVDLYFADRYSLAILDAIAIRGATDEELAKAAANFFNDVFIMDQNACSSPQLIIWSGSDAGARQRFWSFFFDHVRKRYAMPEIAALDKFTQLCNEAVESSFITGMEKMENLIVRLNIDSLCQNLTKLRGHYGFFHEYVLPAWDDLFKFITEKTQTIITYGINREWLRDELITRGVKGVDRIVPLGEALNIGVFWDGYDIIRQLSRNIALA